MQVAYNEEVDVLTITLAEAPVASSEEVQPGLIVDYDEAGRKISIEILNASHQADDLRAFSYDFAASKQPPASRPRA